MSEKDKRGLFLKSEWERLDSERKNARGMDSDGTSFWNARKEACGFAGIRVFNGGMGSWCGGWGNKKLYDSTPIRALNTSLNGFMSYMLSPTQAWLRLGYGGEAKNGIKADAIYGLNDYFEICQQEILKLYNNTNFYSSMRTFIADGMVQGTAVMLIHKHDDKEHPMCFRTLDPADFCIDENSDGKVDTVFRRFDMSLSSAYKKWGDKLPKKLVDLQNSGNGRNERITFIEAVFPKDSIRDNSGESIDSEIKKTKNTKFSYMVLCEFDNSIIDTGCYDEFPFAVQRWERVSDDTPYGIGLVMRMLPEIKMLNENMKLQLTANKKMINPPITVPMMMRDFDARPGAVNFGDPTQAPVPLKTVSNYEGFAEENERLRQSIYDGLYANLFATLMRTQNQYRTATEVNELKSEALSLMSATLNNLQEEVIIPVVKRTYQIMRDEGLLPPLPNEYVKMFGDDIHIELDGALVSRMRTYLQQQGIDSGIMFLSNVIQGTGNADLMMNFDLDEAVRQGATSHGMPQSIIREKSDVNKEKQRKAEMLEQQRQAELSESATRSMANVGNSGVNVGQMLGLQKENR